MKTQELIEKSLALIRVTLERAEKPVVAWSSGKDSQVMLYLIRQVKPDVPVVRFLGFESGSKHFFGDLISESLGLEVLPLKPYAIDPVATGDHVEIVETYRLSESLALCFPIEAEPDHIPGSGSHCAVERLNWPRGEETLGVDCVFIGHRDEDVDPVYGAIPLQSDTMNTGAGLYVYPLKDWTDADVWAASELLNIPQNQARYARKNMDANPDFFPMCTECLKPTDKKSVICPKVNEPVYAIGKQLNPERRREELRNIFVNLGER